MAFVEKMLDNRRDIHGDERKRKTDYFWRNRTYTNLRSTSFPTDTRTSELNSFPTDIRKKEPKKIPTSFPSDTRKNRRT